MSKVTTIVPTNWLPKEWEEISRQGNDNQVLIKIGHINPENHADPLLTNGNPTATLNGEAVSVHGITTRGTMTKFFETMTQMAASGWMAGYTPERIQEIRSQFNKVQNEKYDTTTDVTITCYADENAAKQVLQNQIVMQTEGIGSMTIPGTTGKLQDYLENPAIKKTMTPEQIELLNKMLPKMKEQQKQTAQIPGKYAIEKLFDCPVVVMEMDNPAYKTFTAPKPITHSDPKKFQGGGFDPLAGKGILPKAPPATPPSKTIKMYMAMQVGNYVITGSLLGGLDVLPAGDTFCESLTEHKVYIETEKVEGQTYTTKHIIPVESTYAKEGYTNKEAVEEILKTVILNIRKHS